MLHSTASRPPSIGAPAALDVSPPQLLPEAVWRAQQRAHQERVALWADPHLARASRGEKHPVYDFLFTYYSFRASWLRQWHPGPNVILAGESAREFLRWPEYRETPAGVRLDLSSLPAKRRTSLIWIRDLLAATATRAPAFGCFGLHEWAMVYRQTPDEVRHNAYTLRFPPEDLARIVENQPLRCTHFDAFRFFTTPARPLNKYQPERATLSEHEQRGCLHANMDLYKWASKLSPFTPSDLLADCFALARDLRELDMRASPYDLAALGFAPIPIETPEGRMEYERQQRAFTARSEPLRARLLGLCETLISA
jgi:hypothetical protein